MTASVVRPAVVCTAGTVVSAAVDRGWARRQTDEPREPRAQPPSRSINFLYTRKDPS